MDRRIIFILGILIGFGMGFGVGVSYAAVQCLEKGLSFLQNNGVNITIDSETLLNAFNKYRGT